MVYCSQYIFLIRIYYIATILYGIFCDVVFDIFFEALPLATHRSTRAETYAVTLSIVMYIVTQYIFMTIFTTILWDICTIYIVYYTVYYIVYYIVNRQYILRLSGLQYPYSKVYCTILNAIYIVRGDFQKYTKNTLKIYPKTKNNMI